MGNLSDSGKATGANAVRSAISTGQEKEQEQNEHQHQHQHSNEKRESHRRYLQQLLLFPWRRRQQQSEKQEQPEKHHQQAQIQQEQPEPPKVPGPNSLKAVANVTTTATTFAPSSSSSTSTSSSASVSASVSAASTSVPPSSSQSLTTSSFPVADFNPSNRPVSFSGAPPTALRPLQDSPSISTSTSAAPLPPPSRVDGQTNDARHGTFSDSSSALPEARLTLENKPVKMASHSSIPNSTPNPTAVSAMRRRESLSEIRAANPDLALTGNIISATFSTPHTFRYLKGGDWVSISCRSLPLCVLGGKSSSSLSRHPTTPSLDLGAHASHFTDAVMFRVCVAPSSTKF